jgi:hypothetical protein
LLFFLFAFHLQLLYSMYSNAKNLVNQHTSIVACMNRFFLYNKVELNYTTKALSHKSTFI